MQFTLDLKYESLPRDADAQQTTAALIRHAVNKKYPDGMPRSETRLWGRLEEEFSGGATTLELSLEQYNFIRDAVQATTWPVPWARMAVTLMDAIDDLEHAL